MPLSGVHQEDPDGHPFLEWLAINWMINCRILIWKNGRKSTNIPFFLLAKLVEKIVLKGFLLSILAGLKLLPGTHCYSNGRWFTVVFCGCHFLK